MFINNDEVLFENYDMKYVARYGLLKATEKALNFKKTYNLPFLIDTGQLAHFLSVQECELFKLVRGCNSMYHTFSVPKHSGGFRNIDIPFSKLKRIQKTILSRLINKISISKFATAYHKGAHLTDNASPHIGKKYLLKIDICNFFHSISLGDVHRRVFSEYYPQQIGYFLALLCCRNGKLTQGSPTSPAISNIVMKRFDDSFGYWCEKRGLSYTRYCDDITISGNIPLYIAYTKAVKWIKNMRFKINEHKTHFITNASRQTVTGLTVNDKISIKSDYKKKLRQELYYVNKHGIPNVVNHQQMKEYIDIITPKRGYAQYYNNLIGRINYILSIEPNNTYFIKEKRKLIAKGLYYY